MINKLLKSTSIYFFSVFILAASNYSYAVTNYNCDTAFQWTSSGEFHNFEVVRYKGNAYKQNVALTKGVKPDSDHTSWTSLGVCTAATQVSCDFNGDGQMDTAKGFPDADLIGGTVPTSAHRENDTFKDTGEITVTYNDKSPGQPINAIWNQNGLGTQRYAKENARFGFALSVGDFNHDNFCDLAIGAPGFNSSRGMINILYGSPTGLTITVLGENGKPINPSDAQRFDQNSPNVPGGAEVRDEFGRSLAAGDFNGDGYSDLAVGSPGETIESISAIQAGSIYILYGSKVGIQTSNPLPASYVQHISGTQVLDSESGDAYGFTLVAADFDKDSYTDLVVSAPAEDGNTGRVSVFRGSSTGLDTLSQRDFSENTFAAGSAVAFNWFGKFMSITDFNNDGFPDLLIKVHPDPDLHLADRFFNIPGSGTGLVLP